MIEELIRSFYFLCCVSRYHSYLNTACQILNHYNGDEPFTLFIKKFFSSHKKYGSSDRKQIAHLCYCFFRLGKSLPEVSTDQKILIVLFLCSTKPNELLKELKPDWNEKIDLPLNKKYSVITPQFTSDDIFPWKQELSNEIDHQKFCESFFIQPDLFLRLRPGKEKMVIKKLHKAELKFEQINSSCLVLPNTTKIENIIELDKEAVVQDYNSQQIGKFFNIDFAAPPNENLSVWDCCAGSGGKSLLLYDINPNIDLTVSDIRSSILFNLKKRFAKAGIKNYRSFLADLSIPNLKHPASNIQLIICDVPCTGSGTWSRTPEQLYFFDEEKINHYSSLQKKIVSNTIPHLQHKGFFIYITCSVFKKENEEVVELIQHNFSMQLLKKQLLKGYDKKADTMFAALFKKS